MKNRLLLLLVISFFYSFKASSQSWVWGQKGSTAIKADLFANSVATNNTGNVYQVGGFHISITFGSQTLTSSDADVYLVKYDQNGNLLWARQSKTMTDSIGHATIGYSVATDASDNSYITGSASGNVIFGKDTLFGGDYRIFLVKYDPNGNVMWAKQTVTKIPNGSIGWAVAVDNFGNEYVTGNGGFLIKYDKNGNVIRLVAPRSTSPYNNYTYGYSIAPDVWGNIYVAGIFQDSLIFAGYKLYSVGYLSAFIVKYDSSGNVLWAQQSITNNSANIFGRGGYCVATDLSGAAYFTGSFADYVKLGSYTFTTPKDTDISFFVAKYNPGGSIAWAKAATVVKNGSWGSYSVCADDSNHIYVSGGIETGSPASFVFAGDTISVTNNIKDDPTFLLKLDSAGNVICDSTLFDGGGSEPNAIAVNPNGNFIYIGGGFLSSLVFNKDNLIDNTGGVDAYIGRWQSCNKCDLAVTATPPSATICNGQVITLKASGEENYTWSPATGLNVTTGASVIASPSTNTTYTVTGTSSCNSDTSQIDVIVLPSPNKPNITKSVTGDTLFSSATQGNQWYHNDSLINGATDTLLVITGHRGGYYFVLVTNPAFGCSASSDTLNPTGINQLSAISNQLSIYPNPFNNTIYVSISSSAKDIKDWNLQVNDVLGRRLYTLPSLNYNNEIDLSTLPNGIYFMTVTEKTERAVFPVIKQN